MVSGNILGQLKLSLGATAREPKSPLRNEDEYEELTESPLNAPTRLKLIDTLVILFAVSRENYEEEEEEAIRIGNRLGFRRVVPQFSSLYCGYGKAEVELTDKKERVIDHSPQTQRPSEDTHHTTFVHVSRSWAGSITVVVFAWASCPCGLQGAHNDPNDGYAQLLLI